MKIMVIDDEKDLLEIYEEMLSDEGHDLSCFNLPENAIEKITDGYDLIITDKKMPKYTGIDIIKKVEEKSPETPVFMITGDSTEVFDFINSKSLVLKKPINFETLIEQIERLST